MENRQIHTNTNRTLSLLEKCILAAIVLLLALQLHLQFIQEINWDEFYFLSMIYEHQRGELTKALQTFHVHLFGWLPALGVTEVRQIEIARTIMWVCQVGTLVCIFLTMRAFVSRSGSLLSVLAYISAGYIFVHGTSFRADPLAACLMMLCVVLLVRSRLNNKALLVFCGTAALAVMVTVKVVFYAPALIGIGVWRISREERRLAFFIRLCGAAVMTLLIIGGLYVLQVSILPTADTDGSKDMMSSAYKTTLLSSGLFPRMDSIVVSVLSALPQTLLFIAGLSGVLWGVWTRAGAWKTGLILIVLATPLLSFVIYRNAFPYFFAFIFPPAVGLIGYAFDRLKSRTLIQYGLVVAMLSGGVSHYFARFRAPQTAQLSTVAMVHKIFPDPVSYIDRCGMMSSFTKTGFFMSTWGAQAYYRKGVPVLKDGLLNSVTPLLIMNTPILEGALVGGDDIEPHIGLLQEDRNALSNNFIHHWGYIWVAGRHVEVSKTETKINILTPGQYTLESRASVFIGGQSFDNGALVELSRGEHSVSAHQDMSITLRWGDNLYRPEKPARQLPMFTGF